MEKFEIDGTKGPEIFSGFVTKAKSVITALIDNVKANIKEYETKIEDTAKEISDNEISREKCEHEITKMEGKIDTIKDAIENVENTYKKIVDAYSSTSKGETKELYSGIIDSAKTNCEKDVEKNRSEIARLNSDIEAIKNNISEFTKIIDELNRDLENYNTELFRFTKANEYLNKVYDDTSSNLEDIASKKEGSTSKKESKTSKKSESKKTTKPKVNIDTVLEKMEDDESSEKGKAAAPVVEDIRPGVLDTFDSETLKTKEEPVNKQVSNEISFEESLKQIYDLTGYKPNEEKETKKETVEEQPIYTDNLENLFATPSINVAPKNDNLSTSFLDIEFSNWESMLNTPNSLGESSIEPAKPKSIVDGMEDTANQLLNPYGTTLAKLKSLVASEIVYKNGDKVPFELTSEDVIKAVNSVDGNDLKKMKTVGPEITLLRKVKEMKEGNRL